MHLISYASIKHFVWAFVEIEFIVKLRLIVGCGVFLIVEALNRCNILNKLNLLPILSFNNNSPSLCREALQFIQIFRQQTLIIAVCYGDEVLIFLTA